MARNTKGAEFWDFTCEDCEQEIYRLKRGERTAPTRCLTCQTLKEVRTNIARRALTAWLSIRKRKAQGRRIVD